ncbi:hypothetical protein BpHYR1_008803, partial [Brachionus plicatilis]
MCKGGKDGSLTRQECKQFLTNLSCYNKQPSDVVQLDEGVIVGNDETFDDTSRPNKRAKTVEVEANSENANVNCKKCNEPMKKLQVKTFFISSKIYGLPKK